MRPAEPPLQRGVVSQSAKRKPALNVCRRTPISTDRLRTALPRDSCRKYFWKIRGPDFNPCDRFTAVNRWYLRRPKGCRPHPEKPKNNDMRGLLNPDNRRWSPAAF